MHKFFYKVRLAHTNLSAFILGLDTKTPFFRSFQISVNFGLFRAQTMQKVQTFQMLRSWVLHGCFNIQ